MKQTKFILSKVNSAKRVRVQPKNNIQFTTDGKAKELISVCLIMFNLNLKMYFYIFKCSRTTTGCYTFECSKFRHIHSKS